MARVSIGREHGTGKARSQSGRYEAVQAECHYKGIQLRADAKPMSHSGIFDKGDRFCHQRKPCYSDEAPKHQAECGARIGNFLPNETNRCGGGFWHGALVNGLLRPKLPSKEAETSNLLGFL